MTDSKSTYITRAQIQERLGGVSHMYVERAIKHRGFPMPETRFGGRMRFWLLSDVIAWERRMAAQERKR